MGLYGWKQVVIWSLEHACLDDDEKAENITHWEAQWEKFLDDVIKWDEEREKPAPVDENSKM